jgi:hypothetical protein
MLRLVAGCSINPAILGELLIATETYERGIASAMMADLMEFDKALSRKGSGIIQDAISAALDKEEALETAFQVIDESTEREAMNPRACELVVLDLAQHTISASEGVTIPISGEVHVSIGEGRTNQSVTYILPQDWTIQSITE